MSKSVLITGCSDGGIGAAMALEYHSRGHQVFATSRTLKSMESLAGLGIHTLILDVTDPQQIETVKKTVLALTNGKLDILVNNAGVAAFPIPFADMTRSEIRDLFDVNFFGAVEMTQAFLPGIIEAKGSVILIGSIAGLLPVPFNGAYNVSKAALHAYANTLRVEMAPFGVKVMTVLSGMVQTKLDTHLSKLKEGSIFTPIKDEAEKNRTNEGTPALSAEVWSKQVVSKTLQGPSKFQGDLYIGPLSWMTWFLKTFMPQSALNWFMSDMFKLNRLKRAA